MKLKILLPSIIFGVLIICNISQTVSLISAICIMVYDILWYIIEKISKSDGVIHIVETPEKMTWKFELTSEPETIRKKKSVTFGVKDSSS